MTAIASRISTSSDEFAANIVVVALFEGIGYAQFADVCEIHVVLYRVN